MFNIIDGFPSVAWREHFTIDEAHEAALACNVLFNLNIRLQEVLNEIREVERMKRIHEDALREDDERSDPEYYATLLYDRLHTINIGDCSGDCECEGFTNCYHAWCQECVEAAVANRRAEGAKGTITVRFGYHPQRVALVSPDGVISDEHDEPSDCSEDDEHEDGD